MINMNHLRSFYICALHKNVTKAAEELKVSQPSVSQQLKAFEEEIGFSLFYRNGRTFDLTPQGKRLFEKSQTIFDSLIGIQDFIEQRSEVSGAVHLSVSEEIERPFIAKITSELISSSIFSEAQFFVHSVDDKMITEKQKVKNQLILSHKAMSQGRLIQTFEFPVKLITKKQNIEINQAKQSNVNAVIAALGQKIILPAKTHTLRAEIEQHVNMAELQNAVLMESNIMACLTEAVRQGAGCSLLPIQYVYEDVKKNKLSVYGPANGFWKYKIYLYAGIEADESVVKEVRHIIQRFTIEKGG